MLESISSKLFYNAELLKIALMFLIYSIILYVFFKKIFKTKKNLIVALTILGYGIISLTKLGSTSFPTTTWQPIDENQSIVFEVKDDNKLFDKIYALYNEGDNNNNLNNKYQIGSESINIYGSNNLFDWQFITDLSKGSIFQYNIKEAEGDFKYLKLVCNNVNATLTELAFKHKNEDKFLKLKIMEDKFQASKYPADLIIDETNKIPFEPTYYDEGYFDEVYHPRNAWEIANGQFLYPVVHPLLGTSIIALAIKIFGLSPFSWRIMGAIAGIFILVIFSLILKKIFKNEYLTNIGTILLACDFMHLTTSRIGTLEPFSILFILLMTYFMILYFYEIKYHKELLYLFLSGLFMGLGWSTKWTSIYSSVALAIIFFQALYIKHKKEYKIIIKTLLWCILFFIIIPGFIYIFSFSWTVLYKNQPLTVKNIIEYNINMFKYHKNLTATHPFQSVWYEWLLNIQPVWYYFKTTKQGLSMSISCFSNPVIAWSGIFALCYTFFKTVKTKDKTGFIIMISFLSAFVPWMIISRCLFAYHFYPSTPFLIMAIVYTIKNFMKLYNCKKFINIYVIICIITFIIFMPVITGFATSSVYYNNFLKWLPTWYFGA